MNNDLLSYLIDELQGILESLAAAAEDPWVLDRFLQALGATDPRLTGALVEALKGLGESIDAFEALQTGSPSLKTIGQALDGIRNLFAGVQALSQTSGSQYAQLGEDLLNLAVLTWLRTTSPLAYQIAATIGIAEFQRMPPISIGDEVVRLPVPVERLAFDRIGTLFTNPLALIREQLPAAPLSTVANAQQTADTLADRFSGLFNALGVPWSYGYPPEHEKFLGNVAPLAAYTMVLYLPTSITGDDVTAGVCINLSSADADDLGIVLTPIGALTLQTTAGQWTVSAQLAADVQALAFGGGKGFKLLASAGSTEVHLLAKAAMFAPPADPTGVATGSTGTTSGAGSPAPTVPAAVVGSPNGTRLEFGAPTLTVNLDATVSSIDGGFSADTGASALVIHPGDTDSFLASILPSQGARLDFELGLAWSRSNGLRWTGGGGIDVTLPIGLTIGAGSAGLTLVSVELKLVVASSSISATTSATVAASIGPIQAVVAGMGIGATVSFPNTGGSLGVADLDLGFTPPTGVGLLVDADSVSGGGFLQYDATKHEYSGMLQLEFNDLALQAYGLITTQVAGGSGYSLLALVDATFPPEQLGWGFTLNGVGGLLAMHRTADTDKLRAALKADKLSTILFPTSAISNAPLVLAQLDALFPTAQGRFLFGPMALIGWGTPTLLTVALAVILELPEPIRIILLARLAARLPSTSSPLVKINMDALGVLDLSQDSLSLDATLYDSKIVGFALSGDMALRANWGTQREFLLAIGGFHPQFTPPAGFPTLQRVTIDMPSGSVSKLRLAAYLALTSNTVQFGANLDVFIGVSGFGLAGHLGFDAMLQIDPFHFDADISGSVALTAGGDTLMSIGLDASLDGPAPWHIAGKFKIHVLFFDVHKSFSATWGDSTPAQPIPAIDVSPLLAAALADSRNWGTSLPANAPALVSLRSQDGATVIANPLALLNVQERIVPLGLQLTRFGAAPLAGAGLFTITDFSINGSSMGKASVQDDFAPAQFFDLTDVEKLSGPSFERYDAGVSLIAPAAKTGLPTLVKTIAYETFYVDGAGGELREDSGQPQTLPFTNMTGLFSIGAAGRAAIWKAGNRRYSAPGKPVTVAPQTFTIADTTTLQSAGIAPATGVTYTAARALLSTAVAAQPSGKDQLQIVALHEMAAS